MSLAGTRTHENLKEAFAGESQANQRYLWIGDRSVAEGETGHGRFQQGLDGLA